MRRQFGYIAAALGLLITTAACSNTTDNVVEIDYHQMGICFAFQNEGGNDVFQSTGVAFVVYHLMTIRNTGRDAKDFQFNHKNIFVNPNGVVAEGKVEQFQTVTDLVVAKGKAVNLLGRRLVVYVPTTREEALTAQFHLLYKGGGVLLVSGASSNDLLGRTPDNICSQSTLPPGGEDPRFRTFSPGAGQSR